MMIKVKYKKIKWLDGFSPGSVAGLCDLNKSGMKDIPEDAAYGYRKNSRLCGWSEVI